MGFLPTSWVPLRFGRKAGKDPLNELVSRMLGLWKSRPTVDYSRNDYDLWRALFYCSPYNNKGAEYIRGARTAKGNVNSTAALPLGNGLEGQVDRPQHGTAPAPAEGRPQAR